MRDVDRAKAMLDGVKAPKGDPLRPRMYWLDGRLRKEHFPSVACWCGPRADYVDPETGATVWVHNQEQ